MFRYKPRAPARGKGSSTAKEMSDAELVSNGGPLERTIQQDLLDLQAAFFQMLQDEQMPHQRSPSHHVKEGKTFACFKAAFHRHRFVSIHNGCPARCDLDSYSQLLYSACLGLLNDSFQPASRAHSQDVKRACFGTFALYALYKTNPFPLPPPSHDEITKEEALRTLPLGVLQTSSGGSSIANAEDKTRTRRTYKSPIRIDKHGFLMLQQLRDVCLAAMAQCEYSSLMSSLSHDDESISESSVPDHHEWSCQCSMERDAVYIVDRMQQEELFEFCEFPGPGTVEGLVGSRFFTATNSVNIDDLRNALQNIEHIETDVTDSQVDWNSDLDLPNLENASSLYISSLRAIKPFELASNRGQSRQSTLVQQTLSAISSRQDHRQMNQYFEQLDRTMLDLCDTSRPVTDADGRSFPIRMQTQQELRTRTGLTARMLQQQLIGFESSIAVVDDSVMVGDTVDAGMEASSDLVEVSRAGGADHNLTTGSQPSSTRTGCKCNITFPETMPSELRKHIEAALRDVDFTRSFYEFEKDTRSVGQAIDEQSNESPAAVPHLDVNGMHSWLRNAEDSDDIEGGEIEFEEKDDDVASVATGMGERALRSLLARVAKDTMKPSYANENKNGKVSIMPTQHSVSSASSCAGSLDVNESSVDGASEGEEEDRSLDVLFATLHTQTATKSTLTDLILQPTETAKTAFCEGMGADIEDSSTVTGVGRNALEVLLSKSTRVTAASKRTRTTNKSQRAAGVVSHSNVDDGVERDDLSTVTGVGRNALEVLLSKAARGGTTESAAATPGARKRTRATRKLQQAPDFSDNVAPVDGVPRDDSSTVTGVGRNALEALLSKATRGNKTSSAPSQAKARVPAAPSRFPKRKRTTYRSRPAQDDDPVEQDESSTVTGVGRNALEALLSKATKGGKTSSMPPPAESRSPAAPPVIPNRKRTAKKSRWTTDVAAQMEPGDSVERDDSSTVTGAGRNALDVLLSKATRGDTTASAPAAPPSVPKRITRATSKFRQAPDIAAHVAPVDGVARDDSSTVTGVGRNALEALLSKAARGNKTSSAPLQAKARVPAAPSGFPKRKRTTSKSQPAQDKDPVEQDESSTVTGTGRHALVLLLSDAAKGDKTSSAPSQDRKRTAKKSKEAQDAVSHAEPCDGVELDDSSTVTGVGRNALDVLLSKAANST